MMGNDNKNLSKETLNQLLDFFIRLFQECSLENNIIISPLSAFFVLGLTASGAKGDTLTQLENAVGMSSEDFTDAMMSLGELFNGCNSDTRTANAILISDHDQISLNEDFLRKAEKIPVSLSIFEGSDGVSAINEWVDRITGGMIKEVIDHIPEDLTIALFNAIAFMSEWEDPYEEDDIYDEDFTSASGDIEEVKMLHSEEESYYEDEDAVGVRKPYKCKGEREYNFVALLPNEDLSLPEYIRSLSAEKLAHILSGFERHWKVETAIPAFTVDSELDLERILEQMGVSDAFDRERADLSGMAELKSGNIYISGLKQKAYIKVDEWGTKAAAVTWDVVGCAPNIYEMKEVKLDRPFMYMIVEQRSQIPIFMGAVLDIDIEQ